jgi:hypothetical protein
MYMDSQFFNDTKIYLSIGRIKNYNKVKIVIKFIVNDSPKQYLLCLK